MAPWVRLRAAYGRVAARKVVSLVTGSSSRLGSVLVKFAQLGQRENISWHLTRVQALLQKAVQCSQKRYISKKVYDFSMALFLGTRQNQKLEVFSTTLGEDASGVGSYNCRQ